MPYIKGNGKTKTKIHIFRKDGWWTSRDRPVEERKIVRKEGSRAVRYINKMNRTTAREARK